MPDTLLIINPLEYDVGPRVIMAGSLGGLGGVCDTRWLIGPTAGLQVRIPISAQADLKLDYKRIETVKADKGYQGPALVCAIYFAPISGYIADRAAIKYLIEQRKMEVWLVPVGESRIAVPFRISVATMIGTTVIEATDFEASAGTRASR